MKFVVFVTSQDIFAKPDIEQLALVANKKHPYIDSKGDVKNAAELLKEDYKNDEDLTIFTALDSEEFHEKG